MPAQKTSRKNIKNHKKVNYKKISIKKYKKMKFSVATFEEPGYKWLLLFQEEFHAEMAEILKSGPSVFEVCSLAFQNLDKLETYRIVPTRIDSLKIFDIEKQNWDNDNSNNDRSFTIKSFIFNICETYIDYKFL
jgi:hypothetical protein